MKKLVLFLLFLSCSHGDPPGITEFASWTKGLAPDGRLEYYFGVDVVDQNSITTRFFARSVVHAATDSGTGEGKLSHRHVRELLASLDNAYQKQDRKAIAGFRDSLTQYITQFPVYLTTRQAKSPALSR